MINDNLQDSLSEKPWESSLRYVYGNALKDITTSVRLFLSTIVNNRILLIKHRITPPEIVYNAVVHIDFTSEQLEVAWKLL